MYKTFLSLRYMTSRPTNWIGMVGIFLAVAALVMILSIMAGFLQQHRDTLRGNIADVVIQPLARKGKMVATADGREIPTKTDVAGMLEIVENHPRVVAAAPQLKWYGLLMPSGREHAFESPLQSAIKLVEVVGIDLEAEVRATEFSASLVAEYSEKPGEGKGCSVGRPTDPEDPFRRLELRGGGRTARPPVPILVGEQLAYLWTLKRGRNVSIFSATFDDEGELNDQASTAEFQVVGSFRTKDNEIDQGRIYMDRRDLADWLQQDPPWTSVLVKLEDYERDKNIVREELAMDLNDAGYTQTIALPSPEFQTWEDFRAQLLRAIRNEKMLMGIMLSLVLVVACFNIFSMLWAMVSEKRRDIGILCALGATSRGVLTMFLLIGLWEAIIGSALGALVGTLGATFIDPIEYWLSRTFGFKIFDRTVYMFDEIPSSVSPLGVLGIVAGAVFFTLLFAAIPAWRAARLDPVEALRNE